MNIRAEVDNLQQRLRDSQNPDGGWSFQGRTSWVEPTAFALLALSIYGNDAACLRAAQWLKQSQRDDGGWSPQLGVTVSTWITSLVILSLLPQDWRGRDLQKALSWVGRQVKEGETPLTRFINRAWGSGAQPDPGFGLSWFPGTAAWLYPTALSVLMFLQSARVTGDSSYGILGVKGQEYILSRRCRDGGWNHGGSRFLSEDAESYPEMTGLALLALGGVPTNQLSYSIERAQAFVASPLSGEGLSWLQLGLVKQHIAMQPTDVRFPCRNPRDLALRILALSADHPRNFLVSANLS